MDTPIVVSAAADGALTYTLEMPPEALPPVAPEALLGAWELARTAALERRWGRRRRLRFTDPRGEPVEIAIADRDAGAWAEAIDRAVGLGTLPGLALCLRLLALVELLTHAGWLDRCCAVTPAGIELDPALLGAAARLPLDPAARLDEAMLRRHLAPRLVAP